MTCSGRAPARDGRDVGDAADVERHAAAPRVAEEQVVHVGHQRRALPPGGDIARAKIGDDRHAGALRDHRGLADLQRAGDPAAEERNRFPFVIDGLPVAADQLRTQLALLNGLGVKLAQQEMRAARCRPALDTVRIAWRTFPGYGTSRKPRPETRGL